MTPITKLLVSLGCLSLAGCSVFFGDDPSPFDWVRPGNQLIFDFYPVADTLIGPDGTVYGDTERAFVVTMEEGLDDAVVFRGTFPQWAGDEGVNGLALPRLGLTSLTVLRADDGLRAAAYRTCEGIPIPGLLLEFVRVPVDPKVGDEYPQYRCEDSVESTIRVEQVRHEVEVPMGVFSTFVLAEPDRRAREFWSEQDGLVRIEVLEEGGDVLGYYELASKNF